MTLVRWTPGYRPARDLIGMQDDVNHFIHSFFGGDARWTDRAPFAPVVDIAETPEEFVIHADLPGVAQKDVKVGLLGDVLTLRGERQEENQENTGTVLRVERATGAFERSFRLGAPVRSDGVKATYRDGVLEVRVPKAEEARQREIPIQNG